VIPVFLRSGFEKFTSDEIEMLSGVYQFEEMNLNFFIGAVISATRNESTRYIREVASKLENALGVNVLAVFASTASADAKVSSMRH
jgi:uncharacterized NAD-dependent epimerase/dehydratase family protein